MGTQENPPSEKVQLLDRLIQLFGRYAPLVGFAALAAAGFIYYTKVQAAKQTELNQIFERNFTSILTQSNSNFKEILAQSKSGQELYSQLNEILAKQMANLSMISQTQQSFLKDSATYLNDKLTKVNSDIELKRQLETSQARIAQLTTELEKIQKEAKELRGQLDEARDSLRQVPDLRAEISRATTTENNLRQKLVELSRAVQHGESAKSDQLATTYLTTYQTDYLPNLLKDIFDLANPSLQFASRLEGQSQADITAALASLKDLGVCLQATYTVNQRPALLLAGGCDASGLKSVVELQFNNLNQVRTVVAWSEVTVFTMPVADWFSSAVMLVGRPHAFGGDESLETVHMPVDADPGSTVSCDTLIEAFITGRRALITEPVFAKGANLKFTPARTESGRISPTSPLYRLLTGAGPQGLLVRRAAYLLQPDAINLISGFSKLEPEVKEAIRGAVAAVAARDRAAVLKFTTINDPAELVEPLMRISSIELVAPPPPPVSPPLPAGSPPAPEPAPVRPTPVQVLVRFRSLSLQPGAPESASVVRSAILKLEPAAAPGPGLQIASITRVADSAGD